VTTVRIGVIGAGHMGYLHAEKVLELAHAGNDLALVGVVDTDAERAQSVAAALETRAVRERSGLYEQADAVVVAVATVAHFEVVREALLAGLDVLVEKPIAATIEEADELVTLADREGRVLHVGHQEWFNAAMRVVRERIEVPRFAEIHRLGMFSPRGTDVDVVRDLMIHDIEILQQLIGAEPERVEAVGIPVLTDFVDIANARLTFENRCVANLTASRVSMTPMRKFRIFQRNAFFSIDFLEQKAALFRRHPQGDGEAPRIEMEELKTDPGDALRAQLQAFVDVIQRGSRPADGVNGSAGVSGREAASALRTALRVVDAMPSLHDLA
jgi:predicted dehydrogenase